MELIQFDSKHIRCFDQSLFNLFCKSRLRDDIGVEVLYGEGRDELFRGDENGFGAGALVSELG